MSRVGRKPIDVPSGVTVTVEEGRVVVEGPKGSLSAPVPEGIQVTLHDSRLSTSRASDEPRMRAFHGLTRSLVANAVEGVTKGFEKRLDVVGIGYKAEVRGRYLNLSLGFSHPIEFPSPEGIELKVEKERKTIPNFVGTIVISGRDKAQVGQVAADIRRLRPPDSYKGKGIRYLGETVRLKVGKKGA